METFTRYCSYRNHLVNLHSEKMREKEPYMPIEELCDNDVIVPVNVQHQHDEVSESTSDHTPVCEVLPDTLDFEEDDMCAEAVLCVSKLRSCSSMTMSSTSFVIESVSSMVKNIVGNLKKASTMESFKKYTDSSQELSPILKKLEQNFDFLNDTFRGLNSE